MRLVYGLIVGVAAITVIGCTEQRGEYFPQGTGQHLHAMKDFKTEHYLKAKGAKSDASLTDASALILDKNSMNFGYFKVVNYETDADFLPKDFQFVGLTDHDYKIRYKFDHKYLLIQKLASSEDAPDYELRSFRKITDEKTGKAIKTVTDLKEQIWVTIAGCEINYVKIESRLNRNFEKTKALAEIQVFRDQATHFRVRKDSCKEFKHVGTEDVFPVSFLTGEWYFSETLLDTNRDMKAFQGFELNQKSRYAQASRVEFDGTRFSIRAFDTNITDEEKKKQDEAKKRGRDEKGVEEFPIVTIPVKSRLSFHVDPNNALSEVTEDKTHWSKQEYVQLDFRRMISRNFTAMDENREVMEMEISHNRKLQDDYFSVVINDRKGGARIKYAFSKIDPEKDKLRRMKARTYFQDDNKWFGFFTTAKMFVQSREKILSQQDIDDKFMIARHKIDGGKIEYRFTRNSPMKYRPIAVKAVKAWEEAFRKAGVNVIFDIKADSEDVSLGDIRYNIINLIEETGGRFLLGYGPSLIDTKTGEIVSATANIRVSSIREVEAANIADYVREKVGFFENNYPCIVRDINLPADKKYPKDYGIAVQSPRNQKCNTWRTLYYNKFKKIENRCPDLKAYAEVRATAQHRENILTNKESLFDDNGKNLLSKCIDEVVEDQLLGTLVHELGHNMGLRHNFRGSADKRNFWGEEWIKKNMPETISADLGASIMDYESPAGEALRLPGKYDIAAIMFGYGGKNGNGAIIKASGFQGETVDPKDVIELDPTKSIDTNLATQKIAAKDVKHFGYCTDEDVDGETDPFCNRNDRGTTPVELAVNRMAQMEVIMATTPFRYDKPFSPEKPADYWMQIKMNFFQPLRRIYEEWRWQLESRGRFPWAYYKKINDPEKSINQYLNQIQSIRKSIGDTEDGYFAASNAIFDFLLNVTMLPNRYCIGIKDNHLKLLELNLIRNEFFQYGRGRGQSLAVTSCADEGVQQTLKNEFDRYLGESGFEFDNVRFIENQMDRDRRPLMDVEGLRTFREAALEHLVRWQAVDNRNLSDVRMVRRLFPRFIDEPQFRHRLHRAFLSRFSDGVVVAPQGLEAKAADGVQGAVDMNKLTLVGAPPADGNDHYFVKLGNFQIEGQMVNSLANTFKDRLGYTQGPTGYEFTDAEGGAVMFDVEITDQSTSSCFLGTKLPRADLSIEDVLKKPAVSTPAVDTNAPAVPAPTLSKTYICPKDQQYSYMSREAIEKYNQARDFYIDFVKGGINSKDFDKNRLGNELKNGLELLMKYMQPPGK